MKKKISIAILLLIVNQNLAQEVTKGKCSSCQSTENLFNRGLIIANGITDPSTSWARYNHPGDNESASVFNQMQFKKDVTYCLKVQFELTKQGGNDFRNAKFHFRAANHLVRNTGGVTPLPTISNTDLIYEERYQGSPYYITQQNSISNNRTYLNTLYVKYTPTADFNQIWFYVTSDASPTIRFHLKNVDIRQDGAKASAKFFNPKKVEKINNTNVSVLCFDSEFLVDGTDSQCEKSYFVGLSEFNLFTWSDIKKLHSDWVKPITPITNNIRITDFLPKGYQLRPNKIYKFRLAVGDPWDAVDIFFKVDCCISNPILNEEIQKENDQMKFE